MASLMYGAGLRLMECLRLRIHDVDLPASQIVVRDGKGFKDRVTMVPETVKPSLETHLAAVKAIHERDLAAGYGRVQMPYALDRKYPNAPKEWGWQFLFPQEKRWVNPRMGDQGRHHVDPAILQRVVSSAPQPAGGGRRNLSDLVGRDGCVSAENRGVPEGHAPRMGCL